MTTPTVITLVSLRELPIDGAYVSKTFGECPQLEDFLRYAAPTKKVYVYEGTPIKGGRWGIWYSERGAK